MGVVPSIVNANGLRKDLESKARAMHAAATDQMLSIAKQSAPKVTGALRRSGTVSSTTVGGGGTTYQSTLRFTAPQAEWTNKGTRPHIIRPRRSRALVFFWPKAGQTMFLKRVHHPGNEAQHWFDRAVTSASWGRALTRVKSRVR